MVAHSDDETLGCGGALARLAAHGWELGVVIMTNGVGSRSERSIAAIQHRRSASRNAAKVLGFRILKGFDFPDNAMDSVPILSVVKAIEKVGEAFAPNVVFTHHAHDLNIDHRITHQATLAAFRPMPSSSVEAILCFEVPSSTGWGSNAEKGFEPHLSIDVSDYFEKKMEALMQYKMEMRPEPHPRSLASIEALARWRGSMAGVSMAECFAIQRMVIRSCTSIAFMSL